MQNLVQSTSTSCSTLTLSLLAKCEQFISGRTNSLIHPKSGSEKARLDENYEGGTAIIASIFLHQRKFHESI